MLMRSSRSTWIAIFLAVTLAHVCLIGWLVYLNPVLFFAPQASDVIYPSFTSGDASSGKIQLSPSTAQAPEERVSDSAQAIEPKQETPQETQPAQEQQPVPEAQTTPEGQIRSEGKTSPANESVPAQPPQSNTLPEPPVKSSRNTGDSTRSEAVSTQQSSPAPQSSPPPSAVAPGPAEIQAKESSASSTSSVSISKDAAITSGHASPAQWVSRLDYADGPPTPVYPPRARQAGQEGKVILRVTIDSSGQTESIEVKTSSSYSSLDEAAKEAVRRVRFRPYTSGGVPMRAMADIPFDFKLNPQ